jgi:glutaredoxin
MNKIGITAIIVTILILFGGASLVSKPKEIPAISGYEYYWGDGCPHCKIVQEFFDSWSGKDKIKIEKFEVWNNTKNAELMAVRAKNCNIIRTEMGVPLLVKPDGTCLTGDQPIIEHYKQLDL